MQKRTTTEWLSLVARGIIRVTAFASRIALVAMMLIVFANVILRYVVSRPLYWGDEVVVNLMIIMVYAGFASVLGKGGHVRVTLIFNRLSSKVQNVLWVIIGLIGTGYVGFLLYALTQLIANSLRIGEFSLVLRWPIAPWQIVIACGAFSLLVAFVMLTIARVGIVLGTVKEKPERSQELKAKEVPQSHD